jgi:hypothetical protein
MIVGEKITLPQVHTWQVYLAKNPNFFGLQKGDEINLDDYELVAKIDGEYPPFQIAQNIDDAWVDNDTTLEVYGDNQNGCRSLSVSDIVCNTITGQCYIVNNIGYHLLEAVDSKSADTSDTERFIDDIYCEWCGKPYDGTEILDNYTAKIVHRRCAASDNYDAESFEAQKNYKSCDACHSKNYLYFMDDETLCDDCITGMEQEWMNIFGRRPDVRGYSNIDIQNPKYFPDENTRQTVLPEFTRYDWYRQRQFQWEGRLGWITLGALGWGLISAIWAGRDSNGN